jgi:hypothetical protein
MVYRALHESRVNLLALTGERLSIGNGFKGEPRLKGAGSCHFNGCRGRHGGMFAKLCSLLEREVRGGKRSRSKKRERYGYSTNSAT